MGCGAQRITARQAELVLRRVEDVVPEAASIPARPPVLPSVSARACVPCASCAAYRASRCDSILGR